MSRNKQNELAKLSNQKPKKNPGGALAKDLEEIRKVQALRERVLGGDLGDRIGQVYVDVAFGADEEGRPVVIQNEYQYRTLHELFRQTVGTPPDRSAKILTEEFLRNVGQVYMSALAEVFGNLPDYADRLEQFRDLLRVGMDSI